MVLQLMGFIFGLLTLFRIKILDRQKLRPTLKIRNRLRLVLSKSHFSKISIIFTKYMQGKTIEYQKSITILTRPFHKKIFYWRKVTMVISTTTSPPRACCYVLSGVGNKRHVYTLYYNNMTRKGETETSVIEIVYDIIYTRVLRYSYTKPSIVPKTVLSLYSLDWELLPWDPKC